MPPYENDNGMIGLMGRLVLDDDDDDRQVQDIPLPLVGVAVKVRESSLFSVQRKSFFLC